MPLKSKRNIIIAGSLLLCIFFANLQAQELAQEVRFSERKAMPFYNLRKIGNTTLFQNHIII